MSNKYGRVVIWVTNPVHPDAECYVDDMVERFTGMDHGVYNDVARAFGGVTVVDLEATLRDNDLLREDLGYVDAVVELAARAVDLSLDQGHLVIVKGSVEQDSSERADNVLRDAILTADKVLYVAFRYDRTLPKSALCPVQDGWVFVATVDDDDGACSETSGKLDCAIWERIKEEDEEDAGG